MATGTPMTFANRDGCGILSSDASQYARFHGELAAEGLIGNAGLNSHRDVHPTRASTQYCAGPGENSARPETSYERWHSRTVRTCPHSRVSARSRQRRSSFAVDHYGSRIDFLLARRLFQSSRSVDKCTVFREGVKSGFWPGEEGNDE